MWQKLGEDSYIEIEIQESEQGAQPSKWRCFLQEINGSQEGEVSLDKEEAIVLVMTLLQSVPDVEKNVLLRFAHFLQGLGVIPARRPYPDWPLQTEETFEQLINMAMEYDQMEHGAE